MGIPLKNISYSAAFKETVPSSPPPSSTEAAKTQPLSDIQAYNFGNIAFSQNKLKRAARLFTQAISRNPQLNAAYHNLGITYQELNQHQLAINTFKQGLANSPNHPQLIAALVQCLYFTCDWQNLKSYVPILDNITSKELSSDTITSETPFLSVLRTQDKQRNLDVARSWSTDAQHSALSTIPHQPQDHQPLRIGYLSSDYRDHATSHLIARLFEHHDHDKFTIYAYSTDRPDKSWHRKHLASTADIFKDVSTLTPAQIAQTIFNNQIDILIDINTYTQGNNCTISAHKPAPIQMSFLGFPGTTGSQFIDYIISDRTVTPQNHLKYYSEKAIIMPHTYQVTDPTQIIASKTTKKAHNLPPDTLIFACFCHNYKIDPQVFNAWTKILKQVDNSILWLLEGNPAAKINLTKAFQKSGLNHNRLIFAQKLDKPAHLSRLKLADIHLDTFTYTGHTTTTDALHVSLPVITKSGFHFASRVSASLLKAVYLDELISTSTKDYITKAISLANNPKKRHAITLSLTKNHPKLPLFDIKRYVCALESGFNHAWKQKMAQRKPIHIIL